MEEVIIITVTKGITTTATRRKITTNHYSKMKVSDRSKKKIRDGALSLAKQNRVWFVDTNIP